MNFDHVLSHAELLAIVQYNPTTGIFTRRVPAGGQRVGSIVGTKLNTGYLIASLKGRKYVLHRLAWFYVYGLYPHEQLDHINGKRDDNRLVNLRVATQSQNCINRPSKTALQKGVYPHPNGGYTVTITNNRQTKYLGYFKSYEEACKVYTDAAAVLHGPFRFEQSRKCAI